MCDRRTLHNKISKLHKRRLRLIYRDKTLTSEELLNKGNSDTIHLRNIQNLAIGIYKIANDISSELTEEGFNFRGEIGCDLRHQNIFRRS